MNWMKFFGFDKTMRKLSQFIKGEWLFQMQIVDTFFILNRFDVENGVSLNEWRIYSVLIEFDGMFSTKRLTINEWSAILFFGVAVFFGWCWIAISSRNSLNCFI